MTSPALSPRVTGPSNSDGGGSPVTVARSKIHTLQISAWGIPPTYDQNGTELTGWIPRYAVHVVAGASIGPKVSDFATETEAISYITNDPDSFIS